MPISDIEAGQQVLAAPDDGLSGAYASNEVGTKIIVGEASLVQLLMLHEDGSSEIISTTDEHPFHVADTAQWTQADGLRIGDELSTITGTAKLQGVIYTTERVPVYNLSIPGSPTYYVGEHGVWVHNAGPCLPLGIAGRFAHARNTVKALNKAGDAAYEAHHLVEVRHFKRGTIAGSASRSPGVAMLRSEHLALTQAVYRLLPTGRTYNLSEIRAAYREAYRDYPQWLGVVEGFLNTVK